MDTTFFRPPWSLFFSWNKSLLLPIVAFALCAIGCAQEAKESNQTLPADATGSTASREITIAAASDLKFALDSIVHGFQQRHPGISVNISYGSSGNFYSQLSNRAPFDLFFSADIEYPRKLVAQGLAAEESIFQYAVGQIVVWAPNESALDVETLGIEALTRPEARKVAIANPEHAPYGKAAEAAMKKLGVYDRVRDRLVHGENISQTAQFIESGAADVGIIALSLAMAPKMKERGKYWVVPLDAYPSLVQGGVVMSWVTDREAATRFVDYVMGPEGRGVLSSYGFILPGE